MYADAMIYGVDVTVSESSVEGAEVRVKLYSIDAETGDFIFRATIINIWYAAGLD